MGRVLSLVNLLRLTNRDRPRGSAAFLVSRQHRHTGAHWQVSATVADGVDMFASPSGLARGWHPPRLWISGSSGLPMGA